MGLLRSVSFLTLASCAVASSAQNLVVNGGFETGDFSGWNTEGTDVGSLFFGVATGNPHSGNYSAYEQLNPFADRPAILSQLVPTVVGQDYALTFYVATAHYRDYYRYFNVSFGDQTIPVATGEAYERFTIRTTATSDTTLLRFTLYAAGTPYSLDDVSVASVPGPAAALPFALMALRRRKRA